MALATTDDVATALGRPLTAGAETDRAEALLVTASSAVMAEAGGYRFEPGDYTVTRFVRRGRVTLPAKVGAVTAVRWVDQCNGTETALAADDWSLRGSTVYGVNYYEVAVDFTVSAAVPDEVVKVAAGIVAATLSSPAAGVQSESSGPFSISFVDSSGRVWFSKSDKQILAKYRRPKPAIGL